MDEHLMTWHSSDETAFLSVTRTAMKSEFEVSFSRSAFPQGTEAALDALDEVERLEQILSVFRFDSRIRYLNLTAHEEPVRVDEELFGLLTWCLEIAVQTDGAVDITSGPFWKIWGFAKREGRIPTESEIVDAKNYVDFRLVELDQENRTVFFHKKGVELNFGCVGKGFALDVGGKKLLEKNVDRFLFHGGLSSVLGCASDHNDTWAIGIAHPLRPGRRLAEIVLKNEAVGTSGSQKQFFRHRGHRYSHLIDPRTGYPAEKVLSVTVKAPDATLAELLSTAFFVLGPEPAAKYCENHPEIAALMILPVKKRAGFEVRKLNFETGIKFLTDDFDCV